MEDIKLTENLSLAPLKPVRLKGLKIAVACMLGMMMGFCLQHLLAL